MRTSAAARVAACSSLAPIATRVKCANRNSTREPYASGFPRPPVDERYS